MLKYIKILILTGIANENWKGNDHNTINLLLLHRHHINHDYDHVPDVYNRDVLPPWDVCPIFHLHWAEVLSNFGFAIILSK